MDEHFKGLDPVTVARIKKAAAEIAATAPPLTPEQIKFLRTIFQQSRVPGSGDGRT